MKRMPNIIVRLVHIDGPLKGEIQEFSDPIIEIGRHPTCHVRFPREATIISRKHARISREGNTFKLTDNNSGNGTFVNGKEIKETVLKSGNIMMFANDGPKVSFLTEVRESVEAPAADPPPQQPEPPPKVEVKKPRPPQPGNAAPLHTPASEAESKPDIEIKSEKATVPLLIQYGPMLKHFKALPVTIGSGPSNQCVLDHPALLDRHAEIIFHNDQYWVKDLTGKKLVAVEGLPVGFQAPLAHEGSLSLTPQGPAFKFLNGGRLMEIEQPPPENLQTPHSPTEENHSSPAPKNGGSFFKKIFR
jgi:pSer/pThr/pTyr-binding forkhead associated (FHA) protein